MKFIRVLEIAFYLIMAGAAVASLAIPLVQFIAERGQ